MQVRHFFVEKQYYADLMPMFRTALTTYPFVLIIPLHLIRTE